MEATRARRYLLPMNQIHQWLCSSEIWARAVARDYMPWALEGTTLGDAALEVGPGYGATTRVLAERTSSLTALELDPKLAAHLEATLGTRVRIVHGDGTQMPFEPHSFTTVACFTMLHHIPSGALQDQLFREAFRVLRPGGTFAGADSVTSLGFRLLHLRDTMVMVDPTTLSARLANAGFSDVDIAVLPGKSFRFRARKTVSR
jgi:SAM-dependent methyltransferase